MSTEEPDSTEAASDDTSGLVSKAKKAAAAVAHGVGEAINGPSDGSRSASGAGSAGYVDNLEADEAAADTEPAPKDDRA